MNEQLLRELLDNLSEIVDRVSECHEEYVEFRDKVHRCTELAGGCCEMNTKLAEQLLETLRAAAPHLNPRERRRLISTADRLLSDSVNFLEAMDRHSKLPD